MVQAKKQTRSQITTTRSPRETQAYGRALALRLAPGDILLLLGPLGSGKTTLVKGLARGLGVAHPVVSPTFVLQKRYPVRRRGITTLHHLDAYRLATPDELRGILDEEFQNSQTGVWCIEWGKKLRGRLPVGRVLTLSFEIAGANRRQLRLTEPKRRPPPTRKGRMRGSA